MAGRPPEPVRPQPVVSEPAVSKPVVSEPVVSEPVLAEPAETPLAEPTANEPVAAEATATQPSGDATTAPDLAEAPTPAMPEAGTAPVSLLPAEASLAQASEIGRAHVRTPVTNANTVCRFLVETKKTKAINHSKTPDINKKIK